MKRVVILTGDGKGKTTSALGMALRAVGHGMRVCLIQFIKDPARTTGERIALMHLPEVEVHVCGKGFIFSKDVPDFSLHVEVAQTGLRLAIEKLASAQYGMVILDEICVALSLGLLSEEDVCDMIRNAGPDISLILTGRDASPGIVNLADTVCRIDCLKHAFSCGCPAQPGIEE